MSTYPTPRDYDTYEPTEDDLLAYRRMRETEAREKGTRRHPFRPRAPWFSYARQVESVRALRLNAAEASLSVRRQRLARIMEYRQDFLLSRDRDRA